MIGEGEGYRMNWRHPLYWCLGRCEGVGVVGWWSLGSGSNFGVVVVMLGGTVAMKQCDVGWMRREMRRSALMEDGKGTNVRAWWDRLVLQRRCLDSPEVVACAGCGLENYSAWQAVPRVSIPAKPNST